MEALGAGMILTPKRPIPTMRNWLGLVFSTLYSLQPEGLKFHEFFHGEDAELRVVDQSPNGRVIV